LISFIHITKRYGAFRLVLSDFNLAVARGEFVALTGASGAGKSTVLRLAAALETPSAGQVRVGDQDLGRMRASALPVFRRSIGFVPQDALLLADRSVLANVMLPAHAAGLDRSECERRAHAALERVGANVGLIGALRPPALSGGEQQRVALARALVNKPALLLVDEPTAHLDAEAARTLLALLDHFAASGVSVLLATHDDGLALPPRARRVRLERGKAHEAAHEAAP
jgi:cell division transport system ATP-binding protein